jgi:triosephosphate isomerase (TIM)
MNGDIGFAEVLLAQLRAATPTALPSVQLAVCPPFPYIGLAAARLSGCGIRWGAQNVCANGNGAFTGEVSAAMLKDMACTYVIVGHSERRAMYGETNAVVAAKIDQVLSAGLTPIVCVGETLAEREADRVKEVISTQVLAALAVLPRNVGADPSFVLAYEPVWAIGTGKTASPEQAQEVHALIRGLLDQAGHAAQKVQILYGGSVKAANAPALFAMPDIDGGLIGGSALSSDEFLGIGAAALRI